MVWVVAQVSRFDRLGDLVERALTSLVRALFGSVELGERATVLMEVGPHYLGWFIAGVVGLVLVAFKYRDAR
jgi:hypothetical protein